MSTLENKVSQPARRSRPPGPRGIDIARIFNDFRRNGLPALERLAGQYGDVVYARLFGKQAFLLCHPDLIHHVLIKNRENYFKIPGGKNVTRFFGNAMQLNNGEYALSLRRLMFPVFQPDRLAKSYSDLIVDATHTVVDGWKPGPRDGVTKELMDLVLDIAVQIHFGSDPGEDTRLMGRLFLAAISSLRNFMLPHWVPSPGNRRYHESVAALDDEVMSRIRKRRSEGSEKSDLLSMFAQLKSDSGQTMSDQQIRDELITMMSAGYQSVAIALNQTLRLIAENPSVDATLADEVRAELAGRLPAAADVQRLCYTEKVIKESLRCCPPAGVIARRAVADDRIGDWQIPAGSRVFLSAWVMHRSPQFFDEPLAFKPERWTKEFERSLPICAYFPFGRGARGCIAGALSTLIVQLITATVTQRYRLEAAQATPADESSWPSILKAGGLSIIVHPRSDSTAERYKSFAPGK